MPLRRSEQGRDDALRLRVVPYVPLDVGLAGADGVAHPQFDRIDLHRMRDEVEMRLGGEGVLRLARRARVARRERVRVHRDRLDARRGDAVAGERQRRAAGQQTGDGLPCRVRAAVEHDAPLMGRDAAVRVDRGA